MSSGESLAHLGDVVLQEVFVQRVVSDLQPADKCERRYYLTTIGDLVELTLKEINLGFKALMS